MSNKVINLIYLTAADFEQLDLNDEWSDYEFEEMDDETAGNSKTHASSKPAAAAAKNKKVIS